MKQESTRVGAKRRERRLKDRLGDRRKAVDPFPAHVVVHLFQMVEIVFDLDRFVKSAGAIDDNPPLSWHAVKQWSQIMPMPTIPRLIRIRPTKINTPDVVST